MQQFQTATLALFETLPTSATIYSSACLVHCLSSNADFYQFTVDGVTMASAMKEWYFSDAPTNVVASCTGWNCTLQCSGGPWQPTNTPCASTTNVCANTYMYATPPSPGAASAPQSAPSATGAVATTVAALAASPSAAPALTLPKLPPAPGHVSRVKDVQAGLGAQGRRRHLLVLSCLLGACWLSFCAVQHHCTRANKRVSSERGRGGAGGRGGLREVSLAGESTRLL